MNTSAIYLPPRSLRARPRTYGVVRVARHGRHLSMNLIPGRIGQANEPTSPSPPTRVRPQSTPSAKNPRTRRQTSPSPPRPADHDRPSRSLAGRRRDGWFFGRGFGGRSAQYLVRTRLCVRWTGLWSVEELPNPPQKGGFGHPISAQAFTCMLMSSGFELIRLLSSTGYPNRFSATLFEYEYRCTEYEYGCPEEHLDCQTRAHSSLSSASRTTRKPTLWTGCQSG